MRKSLVLAVASTLAIPAGLVLTPPASAAVSCRVDYAVASQWGGGFVANVTINNTGDALSSWTVTWSYAAGQQITSAWNAGVTQSGSAVTAKNVGYNGAIGSGGSTSFGFQGTNSGTTNPAPGSFTLNGVACGGGSGGGGGTTTTTSQPRTTTTTTTAPRTTTTAPRTTTTTTPPRTTTTTTSPRPTTTTTTGGSGTWAQCSSDQWAQFTDGAYTLYNDVWGGGAGTQQLCQNSHSNWRVVANHPNTSGVKSYANASLTLNRTLSSMKSLTSSFNVSVPTSGSFETTYDLWANNNAYEIMVWMNKYGQVGPIASSYDANGAVPSASNVTLGGHTWNIYRGSNGSNAVYSFVRTSNTNSGTVDLLALFTWLKTNGWWGDVTLGAQQFGYEISGTGGALTFTTNNYTLSYS
jgi:hypothetical protein